MATPLLDFCLVNPMDRGAWWATVHGGRRVRHNTHTHTHTPQSDGRGSQESNTHKMTAIKRGQS